MKLEPDEIGRVCASLWIEQDERSVIHEVINYHVYLRCPQVILTMNIIFHESIILKI